MTMTSSDPTFVLVHGAASSSGFWDLLLPHLDAPALAVDLPGHAGKPAEPMTLTVDDMATSVVADIDAAGIEACVAVAHSSGCFVIPAVAAAIGRRLRHIVLSPPCVPPEGGNGLDAMKPSYARRNRENMAAARTSGAPFVTPGPPKDAEALRDVYGVRLDDEQLVFMAAPERNPSDSVNFYFQPIRWSAARHVPVTVIRQLRDPITPLALQDEMISRLPTPELATILDLDTGHIPAVTDVAEMARILNAIVEGPSPSGSDRVRDRLRSEGVEVTADLQGKRALVTGGGTGIGFGCAEALLAAGASVTIAGRRLDVLDDAADRLGGDVATVACDITVEEQVEHAVGVAAGGGNVDVLVANAGSGYPGAISQLGADGWEMCLRLNVVGTALCTKHAAAVMDSHGGGSIIAISSTSGTKVQPWLAAYVVSKAALDMFVRCAAIEYARRGIRVNCLQPGYVPTEAMAEAADDALDATLRRATSLGTAGTPADVGNAVAFLASDEAAWITGQVFGVDGGLNVPVMPSMASIAAKLYGDDVVRAVGLPDLTALNQPEEGE